MDAMNDVGLERRQTNPYAWPRTVGVWDGEKLELGFQCNIAAASWWYFICSSWKYRLSPLRFLRAILSNRKKWKTFAGNDVFDDVTEELEKIGLEKALFLPANDYLASISIQGSFQSDVIQPRTRAQFLQNLDRTRGFSSLFATANSEKVSILAGNTRLIERMIEYYGGTLHLNSRVVKISPGHQRRYRISVIVDSSEESRDPEATEFDYVVLAAPLQSSKIDLGDLDILSIDSQDTYIESYVTHFSTPAGFSPDFLGLSMNTSVPQDLFTTKCSSHDPNILSMIADAICYKRGCFPGDDCDECEFENFYRIVSRNRIEDSILARMIGRRCEERTELHDCGITWLHRQFWPYAFPRYQVGHTLLGKIEIAPGLYYLNGAEEAISSMEMSCRMGRNAARKLYSAISSRYV